MRFAKIMLYPIVASSVCVVDVVVVVVVVVVVNFCSNAISSEVYGPIDLKFYVRHPGVGFNQSYGN